MNILIWLHNSPNTIFKNIYKVKPAETIIFDIQVII